MYIQYLYFIFLYNVDTISIVIGSPFTWFPTILMLLFTMQNYKKVNFFVRSLTADSVDIHYDTYNMDKTIKLEDVLPIEGKNQNHNLWTIFLWASLQ